MSPKKLLQGDWLGHPLHPAVVHLPAGLWPAALVFDVMSHAGDDPHPAAVRAAFWCVLVGLAAALLAVPTGIAEWREIKKGKPAYPISLWHMGLNIAAAMLMVASLIIRWRQGVDAGAVAAGALATCAAANALLVVSQYLGGRMVFEHGTGVARVSKKHWRKVAEAGNARLPAES